MVKDTSTNPNSVIIKSNASSLWDLMSMIGIHLKEDDSIGTTSKQEISVEHYLLNIPETIS